MKFETVLNATLKTNFNFQFYRNLEKYYKFRAWLLRHEEQQRAEIARLQAQVATAKKALEEISKGEGAFSRDPLTHASNTIESMKRIAQEALKKAG